MKTEFATITCVILLAVVASAAPKTHLVVLGRPTKISWHAEDNDGKITELRARPLSVDGHIKEFTTGSAHDVTERTFVVQRIYRVNDSLPQDSGPAKWQWQLGGWLLTDRMTGKIQHLEMPEFDPDTSVVSWFRDYAAYCGISEDRQKLSAIVTQLGRRKPLLKKAVGKLDEANNLGPACGAPIWERAPVRVTFQFPSDQKLTFAVKRGAAGAITVVGELTQSDQVADDDDGE